MTVHNPHDRFFRDSFSRPEIARNYLQEYLPADLLALLDLDTLNLQEGTFIDETLREQQSDLLYQTRLRGDGRALYLYFLFEHKSQPELLIALQLLGYLLGIWQEQVKQKRPLTPVIPLVVYHGEKLWHVPTDFFSLLDAPAGLRPYLLDFHYQLSDFSHLSSEEIKGEIWLRVCLSVLRAIFHPGLRHELLPLVEMAFELREKETGVEYIRTILYYLTRATGRVSREELEQALLAQGAPGEQIMNTIAEEYIKQGLEQGLQQGLQEGQEKGRLEATRHIARQLLKLHDVVTVSEITGLPIAEVEALRSEGNCN
ncbi:MAG TPA: Rpn family recombination-promoting nuclease/putative transposase [Chloroflexota bacterium]|nr:Rpn family recombination-promoting nuclease/putative transposase [Chloroflexota bacterium]HUM67362.1 Rpn family recombination-promoting nuclease/putative transposase [Chloroflexota bacterium]